MAENLETRSRKAVVDIRDKVEDMHNVLRDISSKLCHLIRGKSRYTMPLDGYENDFKAY